MVHIASRTPEGFPSHCPLCGASTNLEFAQPAGDATCPNCGQLIWQSAQLLEFLQQLLQERHGISTDLIAPDRVLSDLPTDSLDAVELLMEFEEEFDLSIPDEDAERLKTIGDIIRYIQEQRRKREEQGPE